MKTSYSPVYLSLPNQRALSTNATMRRARPIPSRAMHSQWPQLQSVPQFGLEHAQTLSGLTRRLGTGAEKKPYVAMTEGGREGLSIVLPSCRRGPMGPLRPIEVRHDYQQIDLQITKHPRIRVVQQRIPEWHTEGQAERMEIKA
ncbi:hypothetical protein VC83_06216 [Pseudogymnoascus destructans]|uniref:Uncharacterized protein n=1 Tax=Pseudogymnoascus destructans TaxID=655981 RepID=A0A177ACF5_9PEZI|nr:uncharacterized protein VC83_06216 [Pseudogymnoascus destructans]OAF58951.1 hypothetical protein VC83_06216 [Pseudogymnoascus destructans]